jgi:hypothetical protein
MRLRSGAANFLFGLGRSAVLLLSLFVLVFGLRAASLQTFIVVFGQATNEITSIENNFDNSAAQKEKLGTLWRARSVILNDTLRDEQVLAALVKLLGSDDAYQTTLDEGAVNARAAVLRRYDLFATRVADLPPSRRATLAKNRFDNLANEHAALANAQHAANISSLLAPFGQRIETIASIVVRAQVMPRPHVGANAVRADVNGHSFTGTGDGRHSPNEFKVTEPGPRYRSVSCRVVDGEKVIQFTLPVVTDQIRYEIAQGVATLSYTPNVFATNAMSSAATSGTFFVQSDRNEIYGLFSGTGPGFEIKSGRFRIEIPRALRGP